MRMLCIAAMTLTLTAGGSVTAAQVVRGKGAALQAVWPQQILGKSFEYWLKEIHSKDRSKGETAIQMVLRFGPERAYEALPALIGELKKQTSFLNVDVSIRYHATMAIGNILAASRNPDPELVKEAIAVLNHMLRDNQELVRYQAAEALAKLGPAAKSTIPALITALRDPNTWKTRHGAAVALGFVGLDKEPSAQVIDALVRAVGDTASQVRIGALQSLSNLGRYARQIKKAQLVALILGKANNDPDASVRVWGHMAAMNVAEKVSDSHLLAIAEALRGDDVEARVQAAQALAMMGPKAAKAASRVKAALNDKHDEVASACMMALASIDPDAAAPTLQAILRDKSRPSLAPAAQHALELLRGASAQKAKGLERGGP